MTAIDRVDDLAQGFMAVRDEPRAALVADGSQKTE
jgi:hypothetical protein